MNDPARAAKNAAIFFTLFGLVFTIGNIYQRGGFLPGPLELIKAGAVKYIAFSLCVAWVVFYRYEAAADEIETELLDCRKRKQRRQRPGFPVVRMDTEMPNSVSLARDNKQIVPVSPAHARALYNALELRGWKITKLTLKRARGKDGKRYTNVDGRYNLMMTNWHKWGWISNWSDDLRAGGGIYLSEKGQREIARRAGIHLTSPTD